MSASASVSPQAVEIRVDGRGDVALAVAAANRFAFRAGADRWACAEIATATSELASNILKHASHGTIRLELESHGTSCCIVLSAKDQGPGISDPELALTESYSTAGTLGLGLPSVRRIMDSLEIRCDGPGACCVVARKHFEKIRRANGERS